MNNGQVHLKRLRFLIFPFSIIAGGLFAARWDLIVKDSESYINYHNQVKVDDLTLEIHEAIELAVPWVVAVIYSYALWGKPLKFIHRSLRAVVVLAIAICWLYATIGDLTDLIPNRHDYTIFNCRNKKCYYGRVSSLIGAITGLTMVFEVYVAFKVGPLDLKFRKHQFSAHGGYNTDANVIVVRPDEVNFQAQPPMQQQHQFMQQDALTHIYVRPEPLHYQPLPAPPPTDSLLISSSPR
ncbi:hypothetical protein BGZ93_009597 [Podila epicladia]|nr:hypothetical protein BGZ92_008775 [Podila epicladia]KAG0098984.1 hypothetical protein BGZ93_009597 [Podila epicladia]